MENLISQLVKKGIRIGASEDSLKIQSGNATLTDSDKQELKNFKPQLIRLLNNQKVACLSYPQERLWFLAELGYSLQYHIPNVAKIKGDFDTAALNKTINFIVQRHESFRTCFRQLGDLPVQFISDSIDFKIEDLDISQYKEEEQNGESERIIKEFLSRPFDLSEASLLRMMIIKLSDKEHIIASCMHHIISDGWSSGILLRELNIGYAAFAEGKTPVMQPLKMQYSGYAVWQKETLSQAKMAGQINYWKNQLTGYEDLDIPTDYIRPAKLSGSGKNIGMMLRPDVRDKLIKMVREKRITAFTFLVATSYILLSKYSRQKDICFGMPTANRNHKDLEDIVGFFVNTLIIRIKEEDDENLTMGQLLERVNKVVLEGQENQDIPVEKVIEFLQPARDLSRSPIFQVLINFSKVDNKMAKFGDCEIEGLPFSNPISKFDLTFGFGELPTGDFTLGLEYCDDLFSQDTIIAMLKNFVFTLDFIIDNLETPVAKFEIDNPEDKSKVLDAWNDTEKPLDDYCIHELFSKRAQTSPDSIAVKSDDEQMTYKELDEKSNQLAIYLKINQKEREEVIGISMSRSPQMVVAILAVLKSGAAYLPLDPGYPKERLQHMLEDTKVKTIVTDQQSDELMRTISEEPITTIPVELKWDEISQSVADQSLTPATGTDSLAYVIYTSGSTGKPKGVMITHKNVVNHNLSAIDIYKLTEADNVMQFSTINFDIFVEEVFPTLLTGASLIMLDQENYLNISYIKDTIINQQVSVVNWPTAFWHSMSDEDFSDTDLRMVIIGGEKAEMSYFKNWQKNNAEVSVMNTYGPTETTVISLYHEIKPTENRSIPVGKPIHNTQVYVMNDHLMPLGIGIPGELCIAGAGLSNGYLNNDQLTSEKFVVADAVGGKRIYRTGDLVRWLADGTIEFLGRIDEQVKIRGFRVEPGEVENALVSHPEVESGTVIARNSNTGKQLVAFYVSNRQLGDSELKIYLAARIPEYMIPVAFIQLDELPITPGGKINKRELKNYKIDFTGKSKYVAPETPIQKKLVEIWERVTKADKLGITHNFFEIGGNSIMATQLMSVINKEMNQEITLTMLFENPDIDRLSRLVKSFESPDNSGTDELEMETLEF